LESRFGRYEISDGRRDRVAFVAVRLPLCSAVDAAVKVSYIPLRFGKDDAPVPCLSGAEVSLGEAFLYPHHRGVASSRRGEGVWPTKAWFRRLKPTTCHVYLPLPKNLRGQNTGNLFLTEGKKRNVKSVLWFCDIILK
jgi:hypothetical protein